MRVVLFVRELLLLVFYLSYKAVVTLALNIAVLLGHYFALTTCDSQLLRIGNCTHYIDHLIHTEHRCIQNKKQTQTLC